MKPLILPLLFAALLATALGQGTLADAQREAVRLYPELGIAGSVLNKAFLAEVERLRREEPAKLKQPDWPLAVAKSLQAPSPAPSDRKPDQQPPAKGTETPAPSQGPPNEKAPEANDPKANPVSVPAPVPEMDPEWNIPRRHSLQEEYEKLGLAVKDQGRRGSCTAFACLGVMEFLLAKRNQNVRLSEQFAAWAADKVARQPGKKGGYAPSDIVDGIRMYGIATEELMPYRTGAVGRPSKEALADAEKRKAIAVTMFTQKDQMDGFPEPVLRAICGAIAQGSPVTVGTGWPVKDNLDKAGMLNERGVSDRKGHAIVLVGYARDATAPGGGIFTFRQSWGTDYGNGGYAKLSFEFLKKHGWEAFAIQPF